MVVAITSGVVDNRAPVPQVAVHAVFSACVAISTLPATVVLAAAVVPVEKSVHAHAIYWFITKVVVLYII